MALGQVDFGLVGLVGGLVGFVSFFNGLLASAVGRFYAVSVGAAHRAGNESKGLDDCCRWFNIALTIHTVIPVALLIVGYPVGCWAIDEFLTIPPDRLNACVWVWRFTCISCFVGMVNVPFQAMYTAKQEIAELTVYSFVTTTLNACFLYYMITHPGVWLTRYAAWTCLIGVAPQIIIALRAVMKYPECRFRMNYLFDRLRLRELAKFAFARFIADFSGMASCQVQSILVNKYMGPRYNASMSIGNTVSGQAMNLSGALAGALWPAIANKAGEDCLDDVRRLSFATCRISTVLVLFFALPLILEIHEVLHLWLVTPPPFAAELCVAILANALLQKTTEGYPMAILGLGRGVMEYSNRICLAGFILIGVCWALFALGFGMWSLVAGMLAYGATMVVVRLWQGHTLIGFSARQWLRRIFCPLIFLTIATLVSGSLIRLFLPACFLRVVLTAVICEVVFLPLAWYLAINSSERKRLVGMIRRNIGRLNLF